MLKTKSHAIILLSRATSSFIALLFAYSGIIAQAKNTGSIISYKKIPAGIEGKTAAAIFDIHAYNANIIRVRVSKEKQFQNFSYALLSNKIPSFDFVNVEEKNNTIFLSTKDIKVEIEKKPFFKIIFRNSRNEVINEDMTGGAFGTSFINNKPVVYKKMQGGERYVGLGEALGNLDRKGSGVSLNNTDNYMYGNPRLPMYSSIPFYIGIHHKMLYGIFFNNSHQSFFNFGLSTPYTSVSFDGGDMDYFLIYDTSVAKIIEHYTSLTGRVQMPPIWGLGYHQSRADYYQAKALSVAQTLRQKKIPADCIVLDAEYQLGYEPFRIDSSRFPDMRKLADELAKINMELTASVYPGVNIDSSYDSYNDGLKKNVFLKYSDGSLFKTEIAPLQVLLPDYTNPQTRNWWKNKMKWFAENHIHGYWNDMNEPAVGGSYLPDNLLFNFDGIKASSAEAKNVYGFQMARSSYEAGLQNEKNTRPFVLTRSGFAGVQRYAALWSGDNSASDEGLLTSVLLNSQLGLSGVSFVGYDIGGFIGNGSKELYTRFIQAGAFSPFCRNHKEMYAVDNEPWAYGTEAEAISKTFIGLRYRLMPYFYSAFFNASLTGMPIQQSLCLQYPFDEKVYDHVYQYQFLFGGNILVAPLTSNEKSKKLYLPPGDWYNIYTEEKVRGAKEILEDAPLFKLPIFIKASSIIPMQSLVQSTKEKPSDTLFLHIFNGSEKNSFIYYEDEGDGFSYREKNYCKREIEFDPMNKKLSIAKQGGSFVSKFKKIQLIFHGFVQNNSGLKINNSDSKNISWQSVRILDPLENLSGIYDPVYYQQLRNTENMEMQKTIVIDNLPDEIIVQW
ncbi:MAG: glycoside hydrolase family 31 protein [Bacteroidetes bacterium]|nr:glycoside hydrolase family 31 protein [Bacteroidota bacterium]